MKTNRVLIITGGTISITFVEEYLKNQEFKFVIAADGGLKAVEQLQLPVNYIVGDFDSVSSEILEKYRKKAEDDNSLVIKQFNPVKDATDTQIAIELAIELEADEIVLLGATGTRIDHLIANIHLLYIPLSKKVKAFIVDEHNKIYLLNQNTVVVKEQLYGPYMSIQPFTEYVTGVTLQGFKYPLLNKNMHIGDSLGVSNEVAEAQANILIETGILSVIESKD